MRTFFILFSLAVGEIAFAQNGANVFAFQNLPVSARQAALGGNAVSVRDEDNTFSAVNPAMLNVDNDGQISINAATFLAGSKYGTVNYTKAYEHGHLFGAHLRVMDFGSIPRTDEAGTDLGKFGAMDASLAVGYAYQLTDEWTVGAQANIITSKIDTYSAMAVAGSIAAAYHFKKSGETATLVFRNFGYQFKTYNGTRETLPLQVDLGYTRVLKDFPVAITVTAHDLQKFDISYSYNVNGHEVKLPRKIADHFSLGAEFFPEKAFNLRIGYNVKRGNELAVADQRSFAGLSAGFGLRFGGFKFDFAHARYHNSGSLNMVGVSLNLSGKRYL